MRRESFHARVTLSPTVILCLAVIACTATPAMAELNNWDGFGDWTDDAATNWETSSVPTSSAHVNLRSGTLSINGEDVATQRLWLGHNFGGTASDVTFNMSGGTLTTSLDVSFVGYDNPTMTWNLSGGTVNVGVDPDSHSAYRHMYMLYDTAGAGNNTSAILNITGGELNITGNLIFADQYSSGGMTKSAITRTAHVQLDGGILSANAITAGGQYAGTSTGSTAGGGTLSMDMTGGTLILNNRVSSMGFVTAYGGTGSFVYDYDGAVPGKTVITAVTTPPPPPPPPPPASLGSLTVTVGTATTLVNTPLYINTDSITASRTGALAVFFPQGPSQARTMRISTDAGLTWGPERNPPSYAGGAQEIGLRDGGVLKISGESVPAGGGYYDVKTFKFTDDFQSWTQFTARMYMPDHMDSLDVHEPGLAKGPIIQIPDGDYGAGLNSGDLLMPMYGGLTGDSPTIHRAYLVRSTDEGLTWNFYSSIAYDAVDPNPELPGQYCGAATEPSVALLPNGQMFAIMRSQLNQWGPEYRPLYVAWSDDMGITWTTPVPADVDPEETHDYLYDISPTVQVLDNGVIAVSYGRPGFHVAFSTDNGHTWGDLVHLSELGTATDAPDDIEITGQFDMVKAGPNKLVAVGSDNNGHLKVWPITVELSSPPPPLYGDFDLDGDVDGVDFSHWQIGYPMASGSDLDHGDADGDGDTDGVDFGLWQATYPSNVSGSAITPEPATLLVILVGGFLLLRTRRS